jgi:hypothetical protein
LVSSLHTIKGNNPARRHNDYRYVLHVGAPKFIRQTLLSRSEQIEPYSIIIGDLIPKLSPIGIHPDQSINRDVLKLNNTQEKMDLAEIHRVFHPTKADCAFSSESHGISPK